jgi:hypothetical protein
MGGMLRSPKPKLVPGRKGFAIADCDSANASAKQEILHAMPGIIEAIIKKAQGGSYLHANFLFAFAGVNEADGEGESSGEESLTARLLRHLDDTEPPGASEGAAIKSTSEGEQREPGQRE